MYKTILVPLDGSHLAEGALSIALQIAQCCGSHLVLFHGLETRAPATIHGERHLQGREDAESYLRGLIARIASQMVDHSIDVSYHVHEEAIADIRQGIVEHIDELHPDLIVMSSHGKRGIKKAVLGSIPLQILKKGNVPVLLVQNRGLTVPIRNMLVPLDSASRHDEVMKSAITLAGMLKADLTLFTVVPTVATQKAFHGLSSLQLPMSSRLSLEIESQEVSQHLIEHFKEIKGELASDIQVHTRVVRGDIVKQITKAANDLFPCIIILGTHGKIGMDAFWSDSIAFRLALQSDMPMLFIPL